MPNVKTSRTVTTTDPRARSTSVPMSRLIQTTSPLTGGGNLFNDLTLGIDTSGFGNVFTATRNVFTGHNTFSDVLINGDVQVSGNVGIYGQSRADWIITSGYIGTYDQVVAVAGTVLHGGSSSSSIVDAVGVRGSVVNSGGGTITNAYGGWFGVQYYPSGVTTTAYGVYIDTVSGSVGYGLYQGGTQPNVLGGALYQGSVAAGTRFVTSGELTTTVTNPVAGLQISGGALIVYSDNTNPPAGVGDVPTRGLVIGDVTGGQRFYGLGGEVASDGYRWLLYGSGSIVGRLNIAANDAGDTVSVGIPVSVSATANIIARGDVQVSGADLLAYGRVRTYDELDIADMGGTGSDGYFSRLPDSNGRSYYIYGSGIIQGRTIFKVNTGNERVTFDGIPTLFTVGAGVRIEGNLQASGAVVIYSDNTNPPASVGDTPTRGLVVGDVTTGQRFYGAGAEVANSGPRWALHGSGVITGRVQVVANDPNDRVSIGIPTVFATTANITALGNLQTSGTTIAYSPIYQNQASAASRYVTSGELTVGAGTVTSIVAGRGVTVDPNPITTTGTVGLSDVINFYQDQGLQFQGMAGSTGKIVSDPAAEGGGFGGISYALFGSGILQGRLRLNVNQPRDNIITTMPIFHTSTAAANRYVTSGELTAGAGTVTSIVAGRGLVVDPNPITTTGTVGLADTINFYQDQGIQFQNMAGGTGRILSDPAASGGGFGGISYSLYGSGILQGRLRLNVNQPKDDIITTMPMYQTSTAAANRYLTSGEDTGTTVVSRNNTFTTWYNNSAEQIAINYTVPANALLTNRGYRVVAAGALVGAVNTSMMPVLRYGGRTAASGTVGLVNPVGDAGLAWYFEAELVAMGATNAQSAYAEMVIGGTSTSSGVLAGTAKTGITTNAQLTVDSTQAQELSLTVKTNPIVSSAVSGMLHYAYIQKL